MRKGKNSLRTAVGKPEGRGATCKMQLRWGDMEMNLPDVGWDGVYVICMVQDRDIRGLLWRGVWIIKFSSY
jgi:hypothetical protein